MLSKTLKINSPDQNTYLTNTKYEQAFVVEKDDMDGYKIVDIMQTKIGKNLHYIIEQLKPQKANLNIRQEYITRYAKCHPGCKQG